MHIVNPQKPVQSIAYLVVAILSAVIVGAEPLATALVDLFIAFGGAMTAEQQEALITVVRIIAQLLVTAGVVKIAANHQESQVTPLAAPRLEAGSEVEVLSRAGQPTGDLVRIEPSPPGPVGIPDAVPAGPIEGG